VASRIPQGTMASYAAWSLSPLIAKPCMMTPLDTRRPMAATLGSGRPQRRTHTPLRPLDPLAGDAELGEHVEQQLLHAAHESHHIDGVSQPHDRVADELPGPVPGDLAAAVDVDDGRAAADRPVAALGALAGGLDGRVLEQQQRVGGVAGDDLGVHRPLQIPGLAVLHRPEPTHLDPWT